jgi:ADP-ribose pyrophosphatase
MQNIPIPTAETLISSQHHYTGRVISVKADTVLNPQGETVYRDVVTHPGGVCVLPILPDGRILLIEQYRYATGQVLLEAPAGKLDVEGEAPFEAIQRELWEETGYTAEHWEPWGFIYTAPGFCNERIYLYKAWGLSPSSTPRPIIEDEIIEPKPYTWEALKQIMANNQLEDAKTLALLARYQLQF